MKRKINKKKNQSLLIVFSNLGLGGVQKKIIDIVNTLAKSNPDLSIYILLRRYDDFDLSGKIQNNNVTILNYTDWLKVKTPFLFIFYLIYQTFHFNPKVILSFLSPFSLPAILAKKIFFWRKIRVIVSQDHYTSRSIRDLRYSILNYLGIKLLYPAADYIIAPSLQVKKDLIENYLLREEKIKIIQNWTSFADKKIKKLKQSYDLIYVGRLERIKRIDFFLRAVAEIKKRRKDVTFCIIGDGMDRKRLENLSKKLGIKNNVFFLGTRKNIEYYLAQSRLFVFNSRFEGFPLSILEAMACGVPVLSRSFVGASEVLKDYDNSFIFNSLDSFVEKSLTLINNPSLRNKVVNQAKTDIKSRYSLRNIFSYFRLMRI